MMRFHQSKKILFYLLLSFILFPNFLRAEQSGFFWQVSSNKAIVHILGSVHFFKKEIYPLREKIEQAFRDSDVVVFEVNPKELLSIETLNLFQQRGLYSQGDSLKNHLSENSLKILLPRLQTYGIPIEAAMGMKPWFLAITIQSIELQKLGFSPENGIDIYFFKKAEGKEIKGLETAQYQIEIFDRLSDKLQELFLLYTIRDSEKLTAISQLIFKAWEKGDVSIIEDITFRSLKEDPGLLPIYEKIIYERNLSIASKIQNFLNTDKKYFVIVGAGHLVGDKGIIRILQEKGFQLKRL